MHIKMGDDGRYKATRIDTITFHKEFDSPLTLQYVMYVLGFKKRLVSIFVLEDIGYDVASWHFEDLATNFYRSSQGYTRVERHIQRVYIKEVH